MTDEIKILEELKDFNENFFELYARLNKYKKFIASEEQFRFMADKIFEQYKTHYELFHLKHELDNQRDLYAAQLKCNALIPARHRHWLLWKRDNRAAQLLQEAVRQEVEEFFKKEEALLYEYEPIEPVLNQLATKQTIEQCSTEGNLAIYTKEADLLAAQPTAEPVPNETVPVQAADSAIPPADSAPLAISEDSPTVQEPAENAERTDEWEIVEPTEEETPLEQIARTQTEPKPKKRKQENDHVRKGDPT